jgi:uncharacterized small protein (DUF1192 family)
MGNLLCIAAMRRNYLRLILCHFCASAKYVIMAADGASEAMVTMRNYSILSTPEIEDRIAVLRDNIRQLTEQAAASSGAADEERNSDRIAQQTEELEALLQERDKRLAR